MLGYQSSTLAQAGQAVIAPNGLYQPSPGMASILSHDERSLKIPQNGGAYRNTPNPPRTGGQPSKSDYVRILDAQIEQKRQYEVVSSLQRDQSSKSLQKVTNINPHMPFTNSIDSRKTLDHMSSIQHSQSQQQQQSQQHTAGSYDRAFNPLQELGRTIPQKQPIFPPTSSYQSNQISRAQSRYKNNSTSNGGGGGGGANPGNYYHNTSLQSANSNPSDLSLLRNMYGQHSQSLTALPSISQQQQPRRHNPDRESFFDKWMEPTNQQNQQSTIPRVRGLLQKENQTRQSQNEKERKQQELSDALLEQIMFKKRKKEIEENQKKMEDAMFNEKIRMELRSEHQRAASSRPQSGAKISTLAAKADLIQKRNLESRRQENIVAASKTKFDDVQELPRTPPHQQMLNYQRKIVTEEGPLLRIEKIVDFRPPPEEVSYNQSLMNNNNNNSNQNQNSYSGRRESNPLNNSLQMGGGGYAPQQSQMSPPPEQDMEYMKDYYDFQQKIFQRQMASLKKQVKTYLQFISTQRARWGGKQLGFQQNHMNGGFGNPMMMMPPAGMQQQQNRLFEGMNILENPGLVHRRFDSISPASGALNSNPYTADLHNPAASSFLQASPFRQQPVGQQQQMQQYRMHHPQMSNYSFESLYSDKSSSMLLMNHTQLIPNTSVVARPKHMQAQSMSANYQEKDLLQGIVEKVGENSKNNSSKPRRLSVGHPALREIDQDPFFIELSASRGFANSQFSSSLQQSDGAAGALPSDSEQTAIPPAGGALGTIDEQNEFIPASQRGKYDLEKSSLSRIKRTGSAGSLSASDATILRQSIEKQKKLGFVEKKKAEKARMTYIEKYLWEKLQQEQQEIDEPNSNDRIDSEMEDHLKDIAEIVTQQSSATPQLSESNISQFETQRRTKSLAVAKVLTKQHLLPLHVQRFSTPTNQPPIQSTSSYSKKQAYDPIAYTKAVLPLKKPIDQKRLLLGNQQQQQQLQQNKKFESIPEEDARDVQDEGFESKSKKNPRRSQEDVIKSVVDDYLKRMTATLLGGDDKENSRRPSQEDIVQNVVDEYLSKLTSGLVSAKYAEHSNSVSDVDDDHDDDEGEIDDEEIKIMQSKSPQEQQAIIKSVVSDYLGNMFKEHSGVVIANATPNENNQQSNKQQQLPLHESKQTSNLKNQPVVVEQPKDAGKTKKKQQWTRDIVYEDVFEKKNKNENKSLNSSVKKEVIPEIIEEEEGAEQSASDMHSEPRQSIDSLVKSEFMQTDYGRSQNHQSNLINDSQHLSAQSFTKKERRGSIQEEQDDDDYNQWQQKQQHPTSKLSEQSNGGYTLSNSNASQYLNHHDMLESVSQNFSDQGERQNRRGFDDSYDQAVGGSAIRMGSDVDFMPDESDMFKKPRRRDDETLFEKSLNNMDEMLSIFKDPPPKTSTIKPKSVVTLQNNNSSAIKKKI